MTQDRSVSGSCHGAAPSRRAGAWPQTTASRRLAAHQRSRRSLRRDEALLSRCRYWHQDIPTCRDRLPPAETGHRTCFFGTLLGLRGCTGTGHQRRTTSGRIGREFSLFGKEFEGPRWGQSRRSASRTQNDPMTLCQRSLPVRQFRDTHRPLCLPMRSLPVVAVLPGTQRTTNLTVCVEVSKCQLPPSDRVRSVPSGGAVLHLGKSDRVRRRLARSVGRGLMGTWLSGISS